MFYSRFLESVQRWPGMIALEIQRQPGSNVGSLFEGSLQKTADGHLIESYTYSQTRTLAESVGAWLQRHMLPASSRCAILAANSPRWVITYLGIVASGNTAVPLDTAFHYDQVLKLLHDCTASLLFVDERNLAVARKAVAERNIQLVLIDSTDEGLPSLDEMFKAGPSGFVPAESKPDDLACLLYTSGTTSDPKGVMITHANLRAEMDAAYHIVPFAPGDAILGVLPLFHALAQMANLMFPLAAGAKAVYLDTLATQELMTALRDRDITLFCCVPQFFYLIHDRIWGEVAKKGKIAKFIFAVMLKTSRLGQKVGLNLGKIFFAKVHKLLGPKNRYLVTGGSRFDPAIGRAFHDLGFTILQAYGLTETTGGAFCNPPDNNVNGSVGKPLHGQEAKLINVKHAEDRGGVGVGEIAIRGPIVMKGYYNRPDATEAVLKDGWLHTGDLAYVDKNGNYFIAGRAKDVIVLSSGKNVYPEEIEAYYLKSPWIKEICVMGLESKPGEPLSERLHAVVVPDFELLRQKKIVNSREYVRYDIETISISLPSTKRILSYDIWKEDLPRTTTRKLRRFEIEKRVRELHAADQNSEGPIDKHYTEEERDWLARPEVQRALAIIAKAAKNAPPKIHPNDNLELELGLDSMERVELMVELEHQLGADVDDTAASEVYTVRELIDLVLAQVGNASGAGMGWESLLAVDVADPEVAAITKKRPIVERLWYLVGQAVRVFAKDAFQLKVSGMEKLPEAPFILCSNHQSFLDAPILTSSLPWQTFRNVFYVGTTEIFGEGIRRRFARFLRLIPVDPDANLVPAMRAGAFGLRQGKILVLYPEGERSIEGPPKAFKKGAAILSRHLNVPIVPVAADGFAKAWPRGKFFRRFHPLRIKVGDPIYPDPKESPEVAYDRITSELRERIVGMWQELHEEIGPAESKPMFAHGD